tara:strand:+ start:1951 stop:2136 length:186 start_codon:yes stop_codon:yes gene_type:complete
MKNNESKTLTVEEAAKVLGIGRQKAYELAREGKLPVLRLGKRILVPRIALDRMLERAGMDE